MTANKAGGGTKPSPHAKARAAGVRYSNGQSRMIWRCQRGVESGECVGGSAGMGVVEAAVRDFLRTQVAVIEETAAGVAAATARRSVLEVEQQRAVSELARVESALVRLAVRDAESPMPPAVFESARRELVARRDELMSVGESAAREVRRMGRDHAGAAARLLDLWDELPVENRRSVLGGVIDCVLVRGGEGVVRIVERDERRP